MRADVHEKVTASHLRRDAYLYVRQSTMRQVIENAESGVRQYALRQRAIALGWPTERVIVIDSDQGQSGASSADREGFQRLVAEVGMGRAGIVLGLEVSRLARNSSDWHRLLEICALSDTLILDEDGVYDPCTFNDRLLLGLKGTMSEAELHVLRARLRGGIISKARRGELQSPLPVGFIYDPAGRVVLDPDRSVQQAIRHFFETFARTGSARAAVRALRQEGLLLPSRVHSGPRKGELAWTELCHWRALQLLHNPRYAGAFFFGRQRTRVRADGRTTSEILPREEWLAFIPNAHAGYISLEEFEANERRVASGAQAHGTQRRAGPPREGPALLQGMVVCGRCGGRMTVRYHSRRGEEIPEYVCQREGIQTATRICQHVPGAGVDAAVGELLVRTVSPMALEVALTVQAELETRLDEADRLRHTQVERARYEAELARRRFMAVDPDNRLVADQLEADWNDRLRALQATQQDYERQRAADAIGTTDEQRARIRSLSTDFPSLWRDPRTPQRERKRMARLLIEDVTLQRDEQITCHVRFKGGTTQTMTIPLPLSAPDLRRTNPIIVAEIDALLDHHTDGEIAAILNERGIRSAEGKPFHRLIVNHLRRAHRLASRSDRLRARGLHTVREMAALLGTCTTTVKEWHQAGLLRGERLNDKGEHLYEHPGATLPEKKMGSKLDKRCRLDEVVVNDGQEVQCAT